MAKAKAKKFSLARVILLVVTGVCAVMSFVSMVFNFMNRTYPSLLGGTTKVTYSMSETFDFFSSLSSDTDGVKTIGSAKVFMILGLVIMCLAVVALVANLFLNNKWLGLVSMILGVVAAVCFILFFVLMCIGTNQYAKFTVLDDKCVPSVGVYLVALFGVVASVCTIVKVK